MAGIPEVTSVVGFLAAVPPEDPRYKAKCYGNVVKDKLVEKEWERLSGVKRPL